MKLKNKKTGEIVEWFNNTDGVFPNSLAELNEEWCDVPEEPKEYWYISDFGYVFNHEINNKSVKSTIEEMKSIGNYFLSREEAELAVEKLKALTRLNKCGLKFEGYTDRDRGIGGDIVIYAHIDIPHNNLLEEAQPKMLKDLDLLFCPEEKNETSKED